MVSRIVSCLQSTHGSHAAAYLGALRRTGSIVLNVDSLLRAPAAWGGWESTTLRVAAKLLEPSLMAEQDRILASAVDHIQPELFFTVKGATVSDRFLRYASARDVTTVNFFPDVSMTAHGKRLLRALPLYDWIFTAKSYGPSDAERLFGRTERCITIPHGYDPSIHRPMRADSRQLEIYGADVTFVGTWSPAKQRIAEGVRRCTDVLGRTFKIWGDQWAGRSKSLGDSVQGRSLLADEYALALSCSRVGLGLLSEARDGASSGDLTTTRTFEIPACGCLLIHQDNEELRSFFEVGRECLGFRDIEDLQESLADVLRDPEVGASIASAGYRRATQSGYSVDARLASMLELLGLP